MGALIKLKDNLRYFEVDDSDFTITRDEKKYLDDKYLRSYSIKHYLFHGLFEVLDGELFFYFKNGKVLVNEKGLYFFDDGKFYKKDLKNDEIIEMSEHQIPSEYYYKLKEIEIPKKEDKSNSIDYKPIEGVRKNGKKVK
jgi:hypothetical protein